MSAPRYLPVQLLAAPDEGEGILIGLAAAYDVNYRIGYSLKECLTAGCFDASMAADGGVVPIFFAHDWNPQKSSVPNPPIGVGYVTSTKEGVKVRAELFMEDPKARSIYLAAKAGALREWSIGYKATTVRLDEADTDLEHIDEAELIECSVVVRGANPGTKMIEVRSEPGDEIPPPPADNTPPAPTMHDDAWALLSNPAIRASVMVQLDMTPETGNKE